MIDDDVVEIYTLWDRLKQRFSIIRPQPKSFILGDTVVPVTNVDFALSVSDLKTGLVAISGNGVKVVDTVPSGKRWEVSVSDIERFNGTYDISEFLVIEGGVAMRYHVITPAISECFYHPHPLLLTEGTQLGLQIVNYAAAGNVTWRYWVKETNLEE